jgi:NAD(P)H-dependent FMN reductase
MAGGARAAFVLRNTLAELGFVVAPTGFNVPSVWAAFDAEGKFIHDTAATSLDKFMTEFSWVANTLRDARATRPQ